MGLSLSKESSPRLDPTVELTLTPAVGAVAGETAYSITCTASLADEPGSPDAADQRFPLS